MAKFKYELAEMRMTLQHVLHMQQQQQDARLSSLPLQNGHDKLPALT